MKWKVKWIIEVDIIYVTNFKLVELTLLTVMRCWGTKVLYMVLYVICYMEYFLYVLYGNYFIYDVYISYIWDYRIMGLFYIVLYGVMLYFFV